MNEIYKIQFQLKGGDNTFATFGSATTLQEAQQKIDRHFQPDVPAKITNLLTGEVFDYVR